MKYSEKILFSFRTLYFLPKETVIYFLYVTYKEEIVQFGKVDENFQPVQEK